jgi:dolichyl-phosphate-mannose-protein mannosyltransferase
MNSSTRVELGLIVALTCIAGIVRCVGLDEIAIEHFDEGVYASNLWFPDNGFRYPDQQLYAPPLVPSLIEWSMLIFEEARWAPFVPSLLFGSLTVPLVWFIGRGWFGPSAGIASACLVALSDFHIALSRSALTDVTLAFFLIAAVGLLHAAMTQDRFGLSLLAGVASGLGWSAKYNGWLAMAIAVSGTIAAIGAVRFWLRPSPEGGAAKSTDSKKLSSKIADDEQPVSITSLLAVKHLTVMIVLACAVWYPVYDGLQAHGGYSAVADNHKRFVVGLSGWWSSLLQQESVQRHYAGWLTWFGGMLAVVCATVISNVSRSTWNNENAKSAEQPEDGSNPDGSTWNTKPSRQRIVFVTALTGAIVLSPVIVFVVWSLTTIFASLVNIRRLKTGAIELAEPNSYRWMALWFCLAWLAGLLLATPMYRPFPRLLLPFLSVGWIVTGAACVMLLNASPTPEADSRRNKRWIIIALIIAVCGWRANRMGFRSWQHRSSLANIAEQAIEAASDVAADSPAARDDVKFVLYVYGEPGLFFHVPRDGVPTSPVQDLDFAKPGSNHARVPTFVLVGPHARKSPVFQEQIKEVREQLELIKSYNYRASDFVLLDDIKPSELPKTGPDRVVLYRVRFD